MKKVMTAITILIIIVMMSLLVLVKINNTEVKTIKSEKQLLEIMEGKSVDSDVLEKVRTVLVGNAEKLYDVEYYGPQKTNRRYSRRYKGGRIYDVVEDTISNEVVYEAESVETNKGTTGTLKDYSTTNTQVENVDEADINKTDGDFIYSISDCNVIITDVRDPKNIKIASKINFSTKIIPVDLMLYKNKLIVIYEKEVSKNSNRYYSYKNTVVKTYDISSKESPKEVKSFEIHQGYYTSRCIDNKLYIISSGDLRYADSDEEAVDRAYKEDGKTKELPLKNIKYLKNNPTNVQTIIITENLDNPDEDIKLSSFLMDVENAYVSENSIYLLNETYQRADVKSNPLGKLAGWGGIYAFKDEYEKGYSGKKALYTEIYKFDIEKNGTVNYKSKGKVDGEAINQYSMDESNGHLRIATYDFNKGAKITIFDENMKEIGHSDRFGENEKMYSTRFMGNRAYVVTYQTVDPLFVIDLSDETNPKVLGELYIPGYSMYLHPYDENHIIGIGMETKETVNKDAYGRSRSTTARIVGMKMALFDVSDVRNPKQISQIVIGDSRTTSAILTNPKALLFSKEKELIAIPVNNYNSEFEVSNSETYEDVKNSYISTSKSYVSEGYCVYKINLEEGFKYKGSITHENENSGKYSYSSSYSRQLRGLYIEDNLYTISENKIKVDNLDTLEQVSELNIKSDNMKEVIDYEFVEE